MARIFITEDESIIALDLSLMLQGHGHEIVGMTNNGEKAIEMILKLPPDLVFLDINLQGDIDGIAVAKTIRKIYQSPIIFCSAYSSKVIVEKALKIETSSYMFKPFTAELIKGKLQEVL